MVQLIHSKTSKNCIKSMLVQQGCSLEQFCQKTGISSELAQKLYDDERLIPNTVILEAICKAYPVELASLVVYDPETESLSQLLPTLFGNPDEPMQVTICGCGNLGHVFAGWLSVRQDLRVNVLVSTPEKAQQLQEGIAINNGIAVKRREGEVVGHPHLVTADPAKAIPGSRLVLLCLPSFVEPTVLTQIIPFLDEDTFIGSVPGPGGFNWTAQHLLDENQKKVTIFGMGAIPWMCKISKYGEEVKVLGTKTINGQVSVPAHRASEVSELMGNLLKMPVLNIENFLQITLNPGNQLLHPGITYSMFRDWDGTPLPEPPLFYEDITQDATDILQQMSDELMMLRFALEKRIPNLHLSAVLPLAVSIQAGYGAAVIDRTSLRSTIATNLAYAGIRTPMNQVENGWVPNYQNRFFLEDIPYGVVVLKGLAELADVPTPMLDRVLTWAQEKMGCEYLVDGKLQGQHIAESGAPQRFGLNSLEDLIEMV